MSDKPARSVAEIQQEYQNLAFRAGNLQYEICQKNKDLDLINDTLRSLSFEFVAAQEAAKAAEKQPDASPGTPVEAATEGTAA